MSNTTTTTPETQASEANRPTRTYRREADGYTYWLENGDVIGCPTFLNGEPDFDNATYVYDFILDEEDGGPTANEQKAAIEAEVRQALAEGLAFDAMQHALAHIQEQLGVTTGDFAGIHFSDDDNEKTILEILAEYIRAEMRFQETHREAV